MHECSQEKKKMKNCVALNRSNPFFLRVSYGFDRKCSNLKPDATLKIHISLLNAHTHTRKHQPMFFGLGAIAQVCQKHRCDERYIRSTMDRMRYILDYADRQTDWPREVEGEWNDVTFWNEESQDINRTRQKPTKRKKNGQPFGVNRLHILKCTGELFFSLLLFSSLFVCFFHSSISHRRCNDHDHLSPIWSRMRCHCTALMKTASNTSECAEEIVKVMRGKLREKTKQCKT